MGWGRGEELVGQLTFREGWGKIESPDFRSLEIGFSEVGNYVNPWNFLVKYNLWSWLLGHCNSS